MQFPPRSRRRSFTCTAPAVGLALVLSSPALRAQAVAPSPPGASAASTEASRKDEPVVLSPFQVGSDTERGYMSTAILQGGRGKIDLADVAGQVQVFTKEFLEDIAATTTDEAYLFSAATHTQQTSPEQAPGHLTKILQSLPTLAMRIQQLILPTKAKRASRYRSQSE